MPGVIAMCFSGACTALTVLLLALLNPIPSAGRTTRRPTSKPVLVAKAQPKSSDRPAQKTRLERTQKPQIAPTTLAASLPPGIQGANNESDFRVMGGVPLFADNETATRRVSRTPKPKRKPEPHYPLDARRAGVQGYVTVRMKIDAQGNVEDAIVVKAEPKGVFEKSALDAARRYRFWPAQTSDGSSGRGHH